MEAIERASYFDFLDEYDERLIYQLKYPNVDLHINNLRKSKNYTYICVEVRKILETMINSFVDIDEYYLYDMNLSEKINSINLGDGLDNLRINGSHLIRKNGNESAHSIDPISIGKAQESLIYLDKLLRLYIHDNIDSNFPFETHLYIDDPFIDVIEEELKVLDEKIPYLKNFVDQELIDDIKDISEENKSIKNIIYNFLEIYKEFQEKFNLDIKNIPENVRKSLDEVSYYLFGQVTNKQDEIEGKVQIIKERIDDIIDEKTWINNILAGKGSVTPRQLQVLNHEGQSLQIRGCAGSGKTLCMIAKTVDIVFPKGKESDKKALFITFNTQLSKYLDSILDKLNLDKNRYTAISFDSFTNKLALSHNLVFGEIDYGTINFKAKSDRHRYKGLAYYIKTAMDNVIEARGYDEENLKKHPFLQISPKIVKFLLEEFGWLESREEELSLDEYQEIPRTGRGREFQILRNSVDRKDIYSVYKKYKDIKGNGYYYSIQDAIKEVLESDIKPIYDVIAIDEAQDLSIISIKMLNKLLKPDGKIIIVGDENQKLYKRDFSWKEVGINFRGGNTISLKESLRNTEQIARFSSEILKDSSEHNTDYAVSDPNSVILEKKSIDSIVEMVEKLSKTDEIVCLIFSDGSKQGGFNRRLKNKGIDFQVLDNKKAYKYEKKKVLSNIWLSNRYQIKGLEFDRVIIPYMNYDEIYEKDYESENNLYYVSFSRARNNLNIYYQDKPHQILEEVYPDYLNFQKISDNN